MTVSTPGLPEEFSLQMRELLGASFRQFIYSLSQPGPVSIRTNPRKSSDHAGDRVPWCSNGKYLNERPVFTLDPTFHAGAYYVQEASSMFLEQVFLQLGLKEKPIRVLDACAAPGGKSTHILSLLHPESLLVSNEVIRTRAHILAENIIKWGYANSIVTSNDPAHFEKVNGFFDVIVIDAPCSGEGMFRKDPNAIKEWSLAHTLHCSKRQHRIISDVWPALKSNGILVYCTCTYNTLENEDTLEQFSRQHRFESLCLKTDPAWNIEEVRKNELYGYRFYPHWLRGEGFFLSALKKQEVKSGSLLKIKRTMGKIPDQVVHEVAEWIHNPELFSFERTNDHLSMLPEALCDISIFIAQHFNVISAGTSVATLKANKVIPEHSLALSIHLSKDHFPSAELSLDQAIRFLKKNTIELPEHKKGFTIASYKGLPLGWLNVLDHRTNNLYPKAWRIRMQS